MQCLYTESCRLIGACCEQLQGQVLKMATACVVAHVTCAWCRSFKRVYCCTACCNITGCEPQRSYQQALYKKGSACTLVGYDKPVGKQQAPGEYLLKSSRVVGATHSFVCTCKAVESSSDDVLPGNTCNCVCLPTKPFHVTLAFAATCSWLLATLHNQ